MSIPVRQSMLSNSWRAKLDIEVMSDEALKDIHCNQEQLMAEKNKVLML